MTDISIFGTVHDHAGEPLQMIKVVVYRNAHEIKHVFTGQDGRYTADIPSGTPIAIRFDTHPTLINARAWHPSVATDVPATRDLELNRTLMKVGLMSGPVAEIDALSGYLFAARLLPLNAEANMIREYADTVSSRLGMTLFGNVFAEVKNALEVHFRALAKEQA
jgi:hypothetical protein